jgi:hypothetical protein
MLVTFGLNTFCAEDEIPVLLPGTGYWSDVHPLEGIQ